MTKKKPKRRLGKLGDLRPADDAQPTYKSAESHEALDIDPQVAENRWTERPAPIHEVFHRRSGDATRDQRPDPANRRRPTK